LPPAPAEHHLQAAISAAAIRAAATRSGSGGGGGTGSNGGSPAPTSAGGTPAAGSGNARSSTTNLKPPPPIEEKAYHIPTPDATGIVANYAALYPRSQWQDPSAYVRFSDTVEETSAGPSGLGFGYTLDERDDEWLRDNNRMARGEGTSASAASTPNGGRAKGKEKEEIVVPAMTEDEFELVMGLMERWTDEKYPTLHTVRPRPSGPRTPCAPSATADSRPPGGPFSLRTSRASRPYPTWSPFSRIRCR
jgi:hypothetical protein